jgi:hypothetical protein
MFVSLIWFEGCRLLARLDVCATYHTDCLDSDDHCGVCGNVCGNVVRMLVVLIAGYLDV